jgi:hypothetical protein
LEKWACEKMLTGLQRLEFRCRLLETRKMNWIAALESCKRGDSRFEVMGEREGRTRNHSTITFGIFSRLGLAGTNRSSSMTPTSPSRHET